MPACTPDPGTSHDAVGGWTLSNPYGALADDDAGTLLQTVYEGIME